MSKSFRVNGVVYRHDPKLKGELNGNCNRVDCQKPGAVFYNHSTRKHYCPECADAINRMNPESLGIFGHDLCTRAEQTEHTPGPWFFYFDQMPHPFPNGQWRIKADDDLQFPIAIMAESIGGKKDKHGHNPTIKANVRLAATAPELLDALVGLTDAIKKANVEWLVPECNNAMDAINKALGKEDQQP